MELNSSKNKFNNLKSNYFLEKLFSFPKKKTSLEIIKYNKKIQQNLKMNINDSKKFCEEFSSIEIELVIAKDKYGEFIHIKNKDDEKYFHIYFNNNTKEEIKRTYLNKNENVTNIKIVISHQIKSFERLFYKCECIKHISFPKFYRINITSTSDMFFNCYSLENFDLTNFKTNNITDMDEMFLGSIMKKIDVSNFITNKVIKIYGLFVGCRNLEELNLENFNTENVIDIRGMFEQCKSLKKLNISNFNTSHITTMSSMFRDCTSLEELNINGFDTTNVTDMGYMFYFCTKLKKLNLNHFNTINVVDMNSMFEKM